MRNTLNFGWPHPDSGDHTRTWEYWDTFDLVDRDLKTVKTTADTGKATADTAKATADTATANLAKLPVKGYAGRTNVNSAGAGSITKTITFPVAFAAQPAISTNLTLAVAGNSGWTSRGINGTASGFTMFAAGTAASWTGNIDWQALELNTTVSLLSLPQSDAPEGWHYVTATCTNPECPNHGQPVTGILVPDDPEFWGWAGVVCGQCGEPIDDLVPEA
jgi:hypothetical protein